MSQENVETVRAVYGEWAKGNLRAGLDIYHPDVMFIPGADWVDTGRYLGKDGVKAFMTGWLEGWSEVTLVAEELIAAGDSVVAGVCYRGVGRGSRAPSEERYFQVWTFRGASVLRIEHFPTRAAALEAVGLSE